MAIKKTKRAGTNLAKSSPVKSSAAKHGPANSSRAESRAAACKKKVRKRKKIVQAVRSQTHAKPSDVDGDGGRTDENWADENGTEASWTEKIRAYRTRQDSVARILDETMGVLAKCDPKLWGQRAYWMLVGLVYERLASCEDEISTGELVSLAKVLAENRRVEVRSRSERLDPRDDEKSSGRNGEFPADDLPAGELPEGLVDSVRQLYGVDLEDTNHNNGNKNSKK